jgi:hypothetical protein
LPNSVQQRPPHRALVAKARDVGGRADDKSIRYGQFLAARTCEKQYHEGE